MKKINLTLLVFALVAVFLCDAQAKPGSVASSMKKVPTGRVPTAAGGAPGASSDPVPNPLDTPFRPSHTYPGTDIPLNVIPISIGVVQKDGTKGYGACSAFRINKNWVLTAAHCLEDLGAKNQRIHAAVRRIKWLNAGTSKANGSKGGFEVRLSLPEKDTPANADLYFYRQGYSTQKGAARAAYAAAEDIALIRMEERDPALNQARTSLRQAKGELQALAEMAPGTDMLAPLRTQEKRVAEAEAVRKQFFAQPLNKYSFFTTSPEGVFHFENHTASAYFFEPKKGSSETGDRKFPVKYSCPFLSNPGRGSHELTWRCSVPKGTSGSPLIINGFIVSDMSEGKSSKKEGQGQMVTPLYTQQFHDFLQRAMGKEYPKGLCVMPNLPGPQPKWEPTK